MVLVFNDSSHPCFTVVSQQALDIADRQIPEPWAGRIDEAPLLFISSNPSLNERESYPRARDSRSAAVGHYFNERFGLGEDQVRDGIHPPPHTSGKRRGVAYWVAVRANARLLHGHTSVVPGRDYALTEVVHCKSRQEAGVKSAAPTCTDLWLRPVLEASPPSVVILVGATAQQSVSGLWALICPGGRFARQTLVDADDC